MILFEALTGNVTDVGKERTENQDYFGSYEDTPYGSVWIVCDGMGGAAGGRTASTMAVEIIRDTFQEDSYEGVTAAMKVAVNRANEAIFARGQNEVGLSGMGTTVVLLVIKDGQAYIGHVGDSRIYLIRQGEMIQLTRDQTLVQRMIDESALTVEKAKDHPDRHIITQSIGVASKVEIDIREDSIELELDDCFVLCSDGLSGLVTDDIIREFVLEFEPQRACQKLVDLANKNGGDDNITIQIVKIQEPMDASSNIGKLPGEILAFFKEQWRWVALGACLLVVGILLWSFLMDSGGGEDDSRQEASDMEDVLKEDSTVESEDRDSVD